MRFIYNIQTALWSGIVIANPLPGHHIPPLQPGEEHSDNNYLINNSAFTISITFSNNILLDGDVIYPLLGNVQNLSTHPKLLTCLSSVMLTIVTKKKITQRTSRLADGVLHPMNLNECRYCQ